MWLRRGRPAGFTLLELLIVIVMVGIVLSIAAPHFRGLENDLQNAASETSAFFRQTRTAGMASTSAYRVVVVSSTRLITESASGCSSGAWQPDASLTLDLREGVVMQGLTAGSTLICFSSRGVANASPTIVLVDRQGTTQQIDVYMGGAVVISFLGGGMP